MSLELKLGDITSVSADAIVNAANSQLLPGGGVCGAIHAAAGPGLARACSEYVRTHGPVPTGGAAMTPAFALPARFVIHAVGPVWRGGTACEAEALAEAYCASIELADTARLRSIAFPSIGTGVYGYPVGLAAPLAIAAVRRALEHSEYLHSAIFVLFDRRTFEAYDRAMAA